MEFILKFGLILLLVFLNGFFVASEFALVAIRKTRIDELAQKGNRAAKLVQDAINHLDTYISSTQLGITLASLALGWIGEPALAHFIEQSFTALPPPLATISAHTISIVIAFSLITFLHIVLGELAPKTIALQKAETTSLFIIAPLVLFTKIFKPFIWLLNGAGSIMLKLFGFTNSSEHENVHSLEEIKMILSQSGQSGAIEKKEVEMVKNVFNLGDIPIKHIMVPRTDVTALNITTQLTDVVKRIQKTVHSRFPVYEHSIDNIIGFVHVKDLYKAVLKTKQPLTLAQANIVRKIFSVPETKRADEVLLDMQKKHVHVAVVNDEYGGTAGIVTLEDIIENLVGDIRDEFDEPITDVQKQPDGSYLVDGLVSIDRVQSKFNLLLKGQGYTTIGGLVFGLLGREPKVGDKIQLGSIIFEIQEIERKRIKTIKIRKVSRNQKR